MKRLIITSLLLVTTAPVLAVVGKTPSGEIYFTPEPQFTEICSPEGVVYYGEHGSTSIIPTSPAYLSDGSLKRCEKAENNVSSFEPKKALRRSLNSNDINL